MYYFGLAQVASSPGTRIWASLIEKKLCNITSVVKTRATPYYTRGNYDLIRHLKGSGLGSTNRKLTGKKMWNFHCTPITAPRTKSSDFFLMISCLVIHNFQKMWHLACKWSISTHSNFDERLQPGLEESFEVASRNFDGAKSAPSKLEEGNSSYSKSLKDCEQMGARHFMKWVGDFLIGLF